MIDREADTNHRDKDPFFNGFIPVWALALFGIALLFVLIFFAGIICHLAGCRRPEVPLAEIRTSNVVPPPAPALLTANSRTQSKELTEDSKGF